MKQTVLAVVGDFHYGKKTKTYNTEVAGKKLFEFGDKLETIKKDVGNSVDKLVVALLGDMVDGTGIYPTQAFHQDQTDVTEQISDCNDLLVRLLSEQRKIWGKVDVVTVPGNHGRTSKFNNEASNYDRMLYAALRKDASKFGVKVEAEDTKVGPWLKPFSVRNHKCLLYHGHSINMYSGVPWYGVKARVLGWNASGLSAEMVFMGHYHGFGQWNVTENCTVFLNGSSVSDDTWATENFGTGTVSKWHVIGISDDNPVEWSLGVKV